MNKLIAATIVSGLALAVPGVASALDITNIGPASTIRIVDANGIGGLDALRASAIAGESVVPIEFAGLPRNQTQTLVSELKLDGYTISDIVGVYAGAGNMFLVFVDPVNTNDVDYTS